MGSVLVTGGAGFIGSHLVDSLIKKDYDVHVIDDLSTGKEENINKDCNFYRLSIQTKGVEDIFKKVNFFCVFHLAAQTDVRVSCANPIVDAESNIIGTLNLLSLSKKYGVKKFIFASSGGVIYGNVDKPVSETCLPKPISPYGISKLTDELYIKFFGRYFPYTILRYSNVYGERQDPSGEAGVVSIFTQRMLNNEQCILYGYGKPKRDYIYVDDVVKANILSMAKADNEILNIGSGEVTKVDELFSLLKRLTDADTPPLYKSLREGEIEASQLCVDKAKKILGWEPSIGLEEGLSRVVNWLKGG